MKRAMRILAILVAFQFGPTARADIIQHVFDGGTGVLSFALPVGQSFTAVDASISWVGFRIREMNPAFDPTLTFELRDGAGTGGALIASLTGTPAPGHDDFYSLNFIGTTLTVGNPYTIRVVLPPGGFPNDAHWGFGFAGSDVYAGGTPYFNGAPAPGNDFTFHVLSAASVPEPGTLVFTGALGAAAGGLAWHRRRKPLLTSENDLNQ